MKSLTGNSREEWLISVFRPYRDWPRSRHKDGKRSVWWRRFATRDAVLDAGELLVDAGYVYKQDWVCSKVFVDAVAPPIKHYAARHNTSPRVNYTDKDMWISREGFGGRLNARPIAGGWRRKARRR